MPYTKEERRIRNSIQDTSAKTPVSVVRNNKSQEKEIQKQIKNVIVTTTKNVDSVLKDGSVPFTGTIQGVAPTSNLHLATKLYVDQNASSISFELTGNVIGGTSGATAVSTTIADNAITQAKMLDNSVGTAEILNDNVTYAKIQNVSATERVLGRRSSGAGNIEEITPSQLAALVGEADTAGSDPSMFLSGTGTFREPQFSADISGLGDTQIQSLANGHFLRYNYVSEGHVNNKWKNALLLEGDIPNLPTSKITSGTFANARISSGNVTQHQASLSITKSQIPDFGTYDNYSSWTVDTTAGSSMTVNSGNSVTFQAGSGATVSQGNTGSAFTIQYALDLSSAFLSAFSDVASGDQTLGTSSNNNGKFLRVTDQGSSTYRWDAQVLATGDIPTIDISSKTSGTLPVNRGGTGATSGYNNSNWNTAYGWGDHSSANYIVNFILKEGDGSTNTVTSTNKYIDFRTSDSSNRTSVISGAGTSGNPWIVTIGAPNTNSSRASLGIDTDDNVTFATINTGQGANKLYDMNQNVLTSSDVRFDSFGVGTNASGTTGEIRATNEVTAYYSDDRLKDRDKNIENALSKLNQLNGFHYSPNALAESLGYDSSEIKVGVSAQEVLKVLPEAVTEAPIDPQYHAVQYDKLIPLIIEAIKELSSKGCCCGTK